MHAVSTIIRRELNAYFSSPLAYVFIVIFLVLAGSLTFYVGSWLERGQADLRVFFQWHPWLYLFLVPAVGALLALSAALAAACFVKAFGISFLGRPRTPAAADARETDSNSLAAMFFLSALCLVAGILPGLFIDALAPVTTALVGVSMPRQSGLELYEALLQAGKRVPVIFITAHADVTTAVAAMKSGAIEFLEKPFDHPTLADRLEKALALDQQWRRSDARLTQVESKIGSLTERERETLEMIVSGFPNKAMRQDSN